jgi:hypothetical protein
VDAAQLRVLTSAIMSRPCKIDNFGVRSALGSLPLFRRGDMSASFQSGRVGALQIAWPNELSNTRYSNFFDRLVEQMQQKSGQKKFNFFLGSAAPIR